MVHEFSSIILQLSPNPTRYAVRLELADAGKYRYILHDLRGQQVADVKFTRTVSIPMGQLPAGVYLLRITDQQGGEVTRRIVRQ